MNDFKFCTRCGNKSRITAKVCSNCGKRYSKVIIKTEAEKCPNCLSVRRSDAKFCRICGYQFVPSTPAEAPIDQPQVPAIELPPPAKLPPLPPKPPALPQQPVSQRSSTGFILTVDELKRLRKMQTGQILFYPKTPRKPNT